MGLELPLYTDQQHKATGTKFCTSSSTPLFPPHSTFTTNSLIRSCLLLFCAVPLLTSATFVCLTPSGSLWRYKLCSHPSGSENAWKLLPGDSQAVTSVIQVFCTQTNPNFKEWDLNFWFILVQIHHKPAEVDQSLSPSALQVFCTQTNPKFKEWNLNLRFILVQICYNPAEVVSSCSPAHSGLVLVSVMEIQRYNKDTSWLSCKPHTDKECLLWWKSSLLLPDSYLKV